MNGKLHAGHAPERLASRPAPAVDRQLRPGGVIEVFAAPGIEGCYRVRPDLALELVAQGRGLCLHLQPDAALAMGALLVEVAKAHGACEHEAAAIVAGLLGGGDGGAAAHSDEGAGS